MGGLLRIKLTFCALDKVATQLLWDFGAREDVAYEEFVGRLRQRDTVTKGRRRPSEHNCRGA